MKAHAAGMVANFGVGMRVGVVEEMVNSFAGFNGGGSLGRCDGVKRYEHCAIDCSGVVQKSSHNLLDAGELGMWEEGQLRVSGSVLDFLSVDWFFPAVW